LLTDDDDKAAQSTKEEEDEDSVERARKADTNDDEDFPQTDDNDFPDGGGDNPFPEEEEEGIPFDESMEDQLEMQDDDDVMAGDSKCCDGGFDGSLLVFIVSTMAISNTLSRSQILSTTGPNASSKGSMEEVFSLGATNDLDKNFGDDDNEEDRQTAEETTATWHKNTVRVFEALKNKMAPKEDDDDASVVEQVSYNELAHGVTRRTAAGVFFEILQLKTLNFVELHQEEAFGDIQISPGVKFHEEPPTTTTTTTTTTAATE